jgi:SP family xylose:H+ symportor-like MFS transporter
MSLSLSRTLVASSIIAALGGLLFGFDTVVISGAEQQLETIFAPCANLSVDWAKFWHGFLTASALIGTVVGSVAIGKPCDWYGRRYVMFWLAWLFLLSASGCALAWDWYSFVAFRFLGGLGIGGASVVTPMYIAEISPAKWRGRLVALTQFNTVLGIVLAYISNYIIAAMKLGAAEWRLMFSVGAVPAVAYFLLLFSAPRSPRWLMAKGRNDEARRVLQRVGFDSSTGGVDAELEAIRQSIDLEHHSLREPFFQRKYAAPILMAFTIAAFNQLSGVNAVLYYSRRIFESAGFSHSAGLLNSVGLGLVILVFTVLAMTMIDTVGRKKLMLIGSLGYIFSLSATAWAFYTQRTSGSSFTEVGSKTVLLGLLFFIASHAIGQGAVIWVFIGEIFPNRLRARGQAFGSFVHWTFAAVISLTFPLIAERSGGNAFAFYAACMIGQLLWVAIIMPETKGVPLETIQQQLGIQ